MISNPNEQVPTEETQYNDIPFDGNTIEKSLPNEAIKHLSLENISHTEMLLEKHGTEGDVRDFYYVLGAIAQIYQGCDLSSPEKTMRLTSDMRAGTTALLRGLTQGYSLDMHKRQEVLGDKFDDFISSLNEVSADTNNLE